MLICLWFRQVSRYNDNVEEEAEWLGKLKILTIWHLTGKLANPGPGAIK